jgi:hypothetical protein
MILGGGDRVSTSQVPFALWTVAFLYPKWKLIRNRACPLGILYGYYGRPDLHVLPARHVHVKDPIISYGMVVNYEHLR